MNNKNGILANIGTGNCSTTPKTTCSPDMHPYSGQLITTFEGPDQTDQIRKILADKFAINMQ